MRSMMPSRNASSATCSSSWNQRSSRRVGRRRNNFRRQKMTAGRRGHNPPHAMVKRRAGLVSRLLDSHAAKMTRPFKYDVAISATEFDALAAMELKRRLEHVLAKGVNAGAHSNATAPILAAARKALEKDARVVVVMYQRLWGV